jgi:hypothetical protein
MISKAAAVDAGTFDYIVTGAGRPAARLPRD